MSKVFFQRLLSIFLTLVVIILAIPSIFKDFLIIFLALLFFFSTFEFKRKKREE